VRRAVCLVPDARDEAGARRGVCTRVGQQLGVPPDTLRGWVHRAEIDEGGRPGTRTDEHSRLVALEREVRELRRANAIVKAASAFFAAEPDRPLSRLSSSSMITRKNLGSSRPAGTCRSPRKPITRRGPGNRRYNRLPTKAQRSVSTRSIRQTTAFMGFGKFTPNCVGRAARLPASRLSG